MCVEPFRELASPSVESRHGSNDIELFKSVVGGLQIRSNGKDLIKAFLTAFSVTIPIGRFVKRRCDKNTLTVFFRVASSLSFLDSLSLHSKEAISPFSL